MKINTILTLLFAVFWGIVACDKQGSPSPREISVLADNWKFLNQDTAGGESIDLSTQNWETVRVPHDWAISGAFDPFADSYSVKLSELGDKVEKRRNSYSGALPHVGISWYRKSLDIPAKDAGKRIHLEFDGVMSHPKVYVNGEYVGGWAYGYSSFGFDISEFVKYGEPNVLAVKVDNPPRSARWYPGAGIYREVRMITTNPVFVKQWGTYITTPAITDKTGSVSIETTILNKSGEPGDFTLETSVYAPQGAKVATSSSAFTVDSTTTEAQLLEVQKPQLWDTQTPNMYKVVTKILKGSEVIDEYHTPFGFRTIEFTSDNGFLLNGIKTPIKGVCLHHDLGPLGAAVNVSSLRHRMKLLQEMGCNAIRTAHNPPTPKMLDLADELGFLIMDEAFDEWEETKVPNGYNKLWDEWAEKDLVAMIQRDKNHPSVIMWSIGNEVREQQKPHGGAYAQRLTDICHREDPTRPTAIGNCDDIKDISKNGLMEGTDLVGWNYHPEEYEIFHKDYPTAKLFGSETNSTLSSRGVYKIPTKQLKLGLKEKEYREPLTHLDAYGLSHTWWSEIPEYEFQMQKDNPHIAGQFVWTGFDYLGEPYPVGWPARSSYFGIIDLCGIPKDLYYLYQAEWSDKEVLHLLPHWNWEEGDKVPIHCFSTYDKAELFLNGKSLGVREKNDETLISQYRLIWEDVPFEAGELKVVALDENDQPAKELIKRTAGQAHTLSLSPDKEVLQVDGKELAFITVSVVDARGTLCPNAENLINFSVEGGSVVAVGNGDPTSMESFVKPYRKAFSGKCMVIVKADGSKSTLVLKARAEGLELQRLSLKTTKTGKSI